MFRTRYIKSLFIVTAAAAAFAAACTKDPVYPDDSDSTDSAEGGEPASLTLNVSIADVGIGVSTRTGSGAGTDEGTDEGTDDGTGTPGTLCGPFDKADLLNPDNPWPELYPVDNNTSPDQHRDNYRVTEAALVDGSMMTCLTVILINYRTNKIVAVRRIPDPDCPNHDVRYTGDGGLQSYPPTDPVEIEKAKKNCILVKKKDGTFDLAPVLRYENGDIVKDDKDHILGLVGTHACVTFDYNESIHHVTEAMVKNDASKKSLVGQSAEKLVRGEYTLLVIANYDHRVTTASKNGLDDGYADTYNVDLELENLANTFHEPENMANGIPDFKSHYEYLYNLRFLMNRTLNIAGQTLVEGKTSNIYNVIPLPLKGADGQPLKPYIRPAVHQTLTAAKEIYLAAGDNVVNIELQRIASRTRVEVKNYADSALKVHSLEFSKNYTQSTTYLFRRNKNNRDYSELATCKNVSTQPPYADHDGKGAPMVDYTGFYNMIDRKPTYGAIVPFIKDYDFDKDKVNDGIIVDAKSKKCIFDALMYESSLDYKDENHDPADPDSFTYTIDVSYPGITDYTTPDLNKIDQEKWKAAGEPTIYNPDKATFEYATDAGAKDYIRIPDTEDKLDKLYESIKNIENGLDATKGESLCFFIESVNDDDKANQYLSEQSDGTIYADRTNVDLSSTGIDVKSYLWVLDGLVKGTDGNYTCYLKNLRSGKHLPTMPKAVAPTDASHMMSTDDTKSQKYILGVNNKKNNGATLPEFSVTFANYFAEPYYADYKWNNYTYLSVWYQTNYLSGWAVADQGCQYRLYPVKLTHKEVLYVGTPRIRKEVTLTAFSDETAVVEKVREIKRNDFVRILVEVSYTPEDGEFKFRVKPWDKRTGAVDFN